jgi:hypothetical protein
VREPPNGTIVKSTLEVSNKGITISFGKFCNSIPFKKEYRKGSMGLVYVADLGLRGGFGINITKGWFEDFIDSVDIIRPNDAVLDFVADLVVCLAFDAGDDITHTLRLLAPPLFIHFELEFELLEERRKKS